MRSFKSNENIHKKEGGSYNVVSANSDPAIGRQRKPEETFCNFANFKQAVDSKTDINQNGVQINASSPKGNERSPEYNVPRSNLISKTYKWAMETRGPKSNSSKLLCLSWLPATLMMIRSKMNELAWRDHFTIISLWEIF